jgi:IS1 family transposase
MHQVDESALDERWSFVQRTAPQRWLWPAMAQQQGIVLAYVCGTHEDDVF